jgi:hypothetical protein
MYAEWGGWSNREGNEVIMKYVLEEVWDYENYFGDGLSPVKDHFRSTLFIGNRGSTVCFRSDHNIVKERCRRWNLRISS